MTDPTLTKVAEISAGLSEEHRTLWIRTILALAGTEPQRRAFIDGYNGNPPPRRSSERMLTNHTFGGRVSALLSGSEQNP